MLVEYLFEIPPITFLIISVSLIILILYSKGVNKQKPKTITEIIPFEYVKVPEVSNTKKPISILSYNIMSYNFTKLEWFPYVKSEYLYPKYRSPRIINEIESVDADLLCLQECDNDLFTEFYKNILQEELGYKCVTHPPTNPNKKNVINVICYKAKQFTELKVHIVDLNEDLGKIDETFSKHKEALMVQLQVKETKEKFVIITTHLYWNPEFEYVRYGQIAKILSTAYKEFKDCPLFLCGDFNSNPKSTVLKYIYNEKPDLSENGAGLKGDISKNKKFIELISDNDFFKNHYSLRSAYDNYKILIDDKKKGKDYSENHPDFTTYSNEVVATLDYIIYTEDKLEMVEVLKVPTNDEVIKKDKLPNKNFPSDHLKIGAKFVFK